MLNILKLALARVNRLIEAAQGLGVEPGAIYAPATANNLDRETCSDQAR